MHPTDKGSPECPISLTCEDQRCLEGLLQEFLRREQQRRVEQTTFIEELQRWLSLHGVDGPAKQVRDTEFDKLVPSTGDNEELFLTSSCEAGHTRTETPAPPTGNNEEKLLTVLSRAVHAGIKKLAPPSGDSEEELLTSSSEGQSPELPQHDLQRLPRASIADQLKDRRKSSPTIDSMAVVLGWKHLSEGPADILPRYSKLAQRVVTNRIFESAVMFTILFNAIFTAREQDLSLSKVFGDVVDTDVLPFASNFAVSTSFAVLFSLEVILRLIAWRRLFFTGPEKAWNIFDFLLTLFSLFELVFASLAAVHASAFRGVRILRSVRGMRFLRVMRYVKELRVMMLSVMHCLLPLLWFSSFLCLVIFIFSVYFAEHAYEVAKSPFVQQSTYKDYKDFFSTFARTMLTLFASVLGGEDWLKILITMMNESYSVSIIVFVMYMTFMILGILNIITGIFVESTLAIAHLDKEVVTQAEIERKVYYTQALRQLFVEFDTMDSGVLVRENFMRYIHSPKVEAYLSGLGLDCSEVENLFNLLDVDSSGCIDLDEFVMGLFRLKGAAKNIDVATIMIEHKKLEKLIIDVATLLESRISEDRCLVAPPGKSSVQGKHVDGVHM